MTGLTLSTKPIRERNIKRQWHLIDVSGKILGRITPQIARLLQGKHKSNYSSSLDVGDYVVVVNAGKVIVSGKKKKTKIYTHYSGYPGGLRKEYFSKLIEQNPGKIVKNAVSGMLPKNKLRDMRLKRLYIFADDNHPYKEKFIKL